MDHVGIEDCSTAHRRRPDRRGAAAHVRVLTALMLPMARTATAAGVLPLAYAFWQALGAEATLWAVAARNGTPPVSPHHLRYYLLGGLTAVALPNALAFLMVSEVGPRLTTTVYAFPPLFTYLISLGLRLENPRKVRAAGIGLGVAGCLAILAPGEQGPPAAAAPWLLLALTVPPSLAVANIYRTLDWPARAQLLALDRPWRNGMDPGHADGPDRARLRTLSLSCSVAAPPSSSARPAT
jgi:drug/metabolite transporter (DMT)-like permease